LPTPNEALLQERLRQLRGQKDMQGLIQKLLQNPQVLDKLSLKPEQMELLRRNPQLVRDIAQRLARDPDWSQLLEKQLGSADRETLEKLAGRNLGPGAIPKQAEDVPAAKERDPASAPPDNPDAKAPPPAENPHVPPPAPPPEDNGVGVSRQLTDFARNLAEKFDTLGNSSGERPLRRLLQGLRTDGQGGLELDLSNNNSSWARALRRFGNRVPLSKLVPKDLGSSIRKLRLPSVPRVGFGNRHSLPTVSGNGLGTGIVWFLALLGLGLVAWKTLARSHGEDAFGRPRAWRLGPWPVQPEAVATRAELVRAFEHLALLCLGREARTCNHRELATLLAEQDRHEPRRREAAEHLAQVYERARYAPDNEPLPDEELAAARRELCFLARVAAA
jgi:hypothetical protein